MLEIYKKGFEALGLDIIVYIKASTSEGHQSYIVYSAEGHPIALFDDMNRAISEIELRNLKCVYTH